LTAAHLQQQADAFIAVDNANEAAPPLRIDWYKNPHHG
jgi:hypothetical protein